MLIIAERREPLSQAVAWTVIGFLTWTVIGFLTSGPFSVRRIKIGRRPSRGLKRIESGRDWVEKSPRDVVALGETISHGGPLVKIRENGLQSI